MAARYQFLGPSLGEMGRLTIICRRCDYRVVMPARLAIKRYGYGATPQAVRQRSRCSECGKNDRVEVTTLGGPSNDA